MNLTKSQKFIVVLSIFWVVISLLSADSLSKRNPFDISNFNTFYSYIFILVLPIWLYWVGVWIWGFGYILGKNTAKPATTDMEVWRNAPHPWLRYFARMMDYSFFALAISYLFLYIFPSALSEVSSSTLETITNPIVLSIILVALWIPVESLFLTTLGTTPGKLLFRISVLNSNGTKLSIFQAFSRSILVAVQGMVLGIPLILLVGLLTNYRYLKDNSITPWDKKGACKIIHKKMNFLNWCILIITFAAPQYLYVQVHNWDREIKRIDMTTFRELLKNYRELTVPLGPLSPDKFSNSALIEHNIQNMHALNLIIPNYEVQIHNAIQNIEKTIFSLDIPPMRKNIEIKAFSKIGHELHSIFNIDRRQREAVIELLTFMKNIIGEYKVEGAQVYFKNQNDQNFYNMMLNKMVFIQKEREEHVQLLQK